MKQINPILKMDYPDPDVIRVDNYYYMVSTTMHFFPGGALLKSVNLVDWEIAGYLFDELDNTPGEKLEREHVDYGQGMWAPCIRFHKGLFYVIFGSHTGKGCTHLYWSEDISGPWNHRVFEKYYHDCSLLFDDDDRVYLVYGNRQINIVELNKDLTGVKEGGLSRMIIEDSADIPLGYEGSHFLKINGRYYVFLIHWPKDTMRTESCFVADKLTDEFVGRDVLQNDRNYYGQGVAQGGIVDTPDGSWYGILFQDSGAVGRIPILVPVSWNGKWPVFGVDGTVPEEFALPVSRKNVKVQELYTSEFSDDYSEEVPKLKLQWQWNHRPDESMWRIDSDRRLYITTDKLSINLTHAKNILTQRLLYPGCVISVTVDASELRDGDMAGLCVLQSCYSYLGIHLNAGRFFLSQIVRFEEDIKHVSTVGDSMPGTMVESVALGGPKVRIRMIAEFGRLKDTVNFYYENEKGRFVKIGIPHKMKFRLDHFTGNRAGLFIFSTRNPGGTACFSDFDYYPG